MLGTLKSLKITEVERRDSVGGSSRIYGLTLGTYAI
jgi:hypothetical protein